MPNVDALTEEWVQKLQFENRVDSNLQTPTSGESMKVEVGDIPLEHLGLAHGPSGNAYGFASQPNKNDKHPPAQNGRSNTSPNNAHLNSILSTQSKTAATAEIAHDAPKSCQHPPDCACYECQRQRRHTSARGRTISIEPSLTAMNASSMSLNIQQEQPPQHQSPVHKPPPPLPPRHIFESHGKELLANDYSTVSSGGQQSAPHPAQVNQNGTYIQRKRPNNISYERHLPQSAYSELDSIYRRQQQQEQQQQHQLDNARESRDIGPEDYQISWQDETGDDILPSLRTFQTIFDEKPHGSEGLSDLLESKTQELKIQQEKQQIDEMDQLQTEPDRSPKRKNCITLSSRNGPQHTPLLYHIVKLQDSKDRMIAYDKALQQCVHADSGLPLWIKNQSNQFSLTIPAPSHRPNFVFKKSTYRSILDFAGRKQKSVLEDLKLKTNKLTSAASSSSNSNTMMPVDVLSTTPTAMDCASYSATPSNPMSNKAPTSRTPCNDIDTPSLSVPRNGTGFQDNLTSIDTDQEQSVKTAKFWNSLGRKSSKTLCTPSIDSVEKSYYPPASIKETTESFETSLDNLCKIMTHIDRSILKSYLENANGDYMKALSVIRVEVTSGKL